MTRPLRIAQVAPVRTSVPAPRGGSIELVTSLLTEGLVARGHVVTLFATADSRTAARLEARFARGYADDLQLWPWELCELFNCAAAVERADEFDVIHVQAAYSPQSLAFTRLVTTTPIVHTVHHAPTPAELRIWQQYPEAPFIAVSSAQARLLAGLDVVGTVRHGIPVEWFPFRETPDDYLVFLGRFTEGKGAEPAIRAARDAGFRIVLAGPENAYYREHVAPMVDGSEVVYVGEVNHRDKATLLGGARALLYPIQRPESFGLVVAEAMACGTPVAAIDRGAVGELVEPGVTGYAFADEADLTAGLGRVVALDRRAVRAAAARALSVDTMVDGYVALYRRLVDQRAARAT